MLKNKYELASKPERDRILGTSFIPSYGPLPVHNVKFNKLVQYLERMNNDLQIPNPSEYQKSIQDTIKMQLNLSRLKILNDYALKEKEAGFGSDLLASLSFRNWCGKSTPIYDNIKNNLDDPNKMFVIDRICRDHDIRYLQAKTRIEQKEADNIMIEEIYNEYVLNFNRNFITGDYKTDFSTWTSSFYTVFNYLMTGIETAYTANVIKGIGIKAGQIAKFGYDVYRTYNIRPNAQNDPYNEYFRGIAEAEAVGNIEDQGDPLAAGVLFANQQREFFARGAQQARAQAPYRVRGLYNRLKNNFSGIALTFVASTIIKDRIFALASLAGIGLKRMIETVTNYRFVDLTKHDVSDEDLENMIKVFETLQNQYLKESNLKPIKIGDEWLNVAIEIPPIQTINDDIKIIVEQNKTYNELNKTLMETQPMPLAPVLEPELEPDAEPIQVYDYEPLTEEELKRLKKYEELNDYFDKIFSETNLVTRPYPDLPLTEPVIDNKKDEILEPLEKDIKDANPSSILDLSNETNEQNEELSRNKNDANDKMEL
jgi:hypothetical protein